MMDNEEELATALEEYKSQLRSVQEALVYAEESQKADLLDLQSKLEEVIQLTQVQKQQKMHASSSMIPTAVSSPASNNIDEEFLRFQAEMAALGEDVRVNSDQSSESCSKQSVPMINYEDAEDDEEISKIISALPGQKCQAPFQQEWGELQYHNAVISSADIDEEEDTQSIECVKVQVMFTNPICDKMKPCPYFLDNVCKFSDEKCRFSHGYEVSLIDIREYVDPDFSSLGRDSLCLAKYTDGNWYKAIIEDVLEGSKFSVKYLQYGNTEIVNIEDIFPLDHESLSSDSSSESDSDSDSQNAASATESQDATASISSSAWLSDNAEISSLGDWEKHTTGIGSKLMAKMGYVLGQGLGKHGEGRTEPIEAVVLPHGKSLDKCMEMRERSELRDPFKLKKKLKQQQKKKEASISAGYAKQRHNVFDFINKKIAQPKVKSLRKPAGSQKPLENLTQDYRSSSNKSLNVQSLQITQNIRRAEQEITKLQNAALRNKDRDKVIHAQLEQKITAQQQLVKNLRLQEQVIQKEQQSRKGKQKLAVF